MHGTGIMRGTNLSNDRLPVPRLHVCDRPLGQRDRGDLGKGKADRSKGCGLE